MGPAEQRWAAQLALFDFKFEYRPGVCNKNADALSRLPAPSAPDKIQDVVPGLAIPAEVRTMAMSNQPARLVNIQAIAASPVRTRADLKTLQSDDPVIGAFLRYWRRGKPPTAPERAKVSPAVTELVWQWFSG